jgi:hypothetical protein
MNLIHLWVTVWERAQQLCQNRSSLWFALFDIKCVLCFYVDHGGDYQIFLPLSAILSTGKSRSIIVWNLVSWEGVVLSFIFSQWCVHKWQVKGIDLAAVCYMFTLRFRMLWIYTNEVCNSKIMILLLFRTHSFSWSTFWLVVYLIGCSSIRHLHRFWIRKTSQVSVAYFSSLKQN